MNLLSGTIKQIDSETLPAGRAARERYREQRGHADRRHADQRRGCVGDAIADLDGMADRKLATLENILLINQIVSGGLHLTGTIGGIPVDLRSR